MSLTIPEIKKSIQEKLHTTYGQTASATKVTDFQKIEDDGFMRKKDALSIAECCKKNRIHVSFRTAGRDTIERIAAHHPCKGHDIMDKSIKKVGENWTYLMPLDPILGKTGEDSMNAVRGFVGSPYKPLKPDGTLDFNAIDRPPKVEVDPLKNTPKITFFLDEVYILEENVVKGIVETNSYSKTSVSALSPENIIRAYTGDYDMHDLIVNGKRAIATTPEEASAIDLLNISILNNSKERMAKASRMKGFKEKKIRYKESPYALIRHGAQTSYLDFLLSDKELKEFKGTMREHGMSLKLPHEGTIIKIDENLVVFNDKGEAYILKGIGQVYKYYVENKLIDQIPFYNFFDCLKNVTADKAEIEGYAAYINYILLNNFRLIIPKKL